MNEHNLLALRGVTLQRTPSQAAVLDVFAIPKYLREWHTELKLCCMNECFQSVKTFKAFVLSWIAHPFSQKETPRSIFKLQIEKVAHVKLRDIAELNIWNFHILAISILISYCGSSILSLNGFRVYEYNGGCKFLQPDWVDQSRWSKIYF